MMTEKIKQRINERVQEQLPALLFEAAVKQHMRHGFKSGCQCVYCNEKRIVNSYGRKTWRNASAIQRIKNKLNELVKDK